MLSFSQPQSLFILGKFRDFYVELCDFLSFSRRNQNKTNSRVFEGEKKSQVVLTSGINKGKPKFWRIFTFYLLTFLKREFWSLFALMKVFPLQNEPQTFLEKKREHLAKKNRKFLLLFNDRNARKWSGSRLKKFYNL